MSSQQLLMGSVSGSAGTSITYNKSYALLDTLAGTESFLISTYNRSVMVFEGVLSATIATSGPSYTGRFLYANADNGTITTGASTGYTAAIGSGLFGETTTPPGYMLFVNYPANNTAYRWNSDDLTTEYITKSAVSTMEVWCDQEQAMFGTYYDGSYTRLCKFSSFDWVAHTASIDTATYTGGGGTTQEIFQNGALVNGRIYITIDRSGAGSFGWVNALNGTYTSVKDYAQNFGRGLMCASSYAGANPYMAIQCGDTNTANRIDIWDTSGALSGQITFPDESTTGYAVVDNIVHDRVNDYIWVKWGSNAVYVIDPGTLSIIDKWTTSDLPGGVMVAGLVGPIGSASGGVYAYGSGFTTLYKLG